MIAIKGAAYFWIYVTKMGKKSLLLEE